ncbi:hypothetical protein NHX12_023644, partial [Muraenolepis orangiensis]
SSLNQKVKHMASRHPELLCSIPGPVPQAVMAIYQSVSPEGTSTPTPEFEIISLLEEQLPVYRLRADRVYGCDHDDWLHTPLIAPDARLDLTAEQIEETLKYFISIYFPFCKEIIRRAEVVQHMRTAQSLELADPINSLEEEAAVEIRKVRKPMATRFPQVLYSIPGKDAEAYGPEVPQPCLSTTDTVWMEGNFFAVKDDEEGTSPLDNVTVTLPSPGPCNVTVIEILPKEKKQKKEERTAVLGQAVVDLLPLLHAVSSDNSAQRPSLEVAVSTPTPLLSEAQRLASNLLAKEVVLMFSEGQLRAGGEREASDRPRRWPQAGSLAPGAQVFPGVVSIQEVLLDEQCGDLTNPEDMEFCREAEMTKRRVCWDMVHRCFLGAGGSARLSERIEECRLCPLEIMKAPPPPVVQGGKASNQSENSAHGSEPEQEISFHGVAYVDMGPLLYPGATRIRGAYRVHPFSESDLLAKAKRTVSVLREQARAGAAQGKPRLGSAAGCHKAGNKASKEVARKPSVAAGGGGDVEPQVKPETGQMYVDAGTYVVVEITLEKPLVPKRRPVEVAKKVMELIPPRPPLPHCTAGAEKAVQEFHNQVTSVVGQVLDQYQQLFAAAFQPGAGPLDPDTQEHRKSQLLGELNYSGKYFALKEQMKSSVVRVVREKMLRTEAFSSPEQLQAFLRQLYVYLVDQMHLALNKAEESQEEDAGLRVVLYVSQLRHFAGEAELIGDFQLAAQYYQERLVREQTEPSHWSDYGSFYMRTGDRVKAEECFHRAISLQQAHLPSLLMCGVLAEIEERYEDAETYLEGATFSPPGSVVAWTLFGMFHQGQNNHFLAERCFMTAGRLSRTSPAGRGETREGREGPQGEGPKLEGPQPQGRENEEREEKMGEWMEEVRPASTKPDTASQTPRCERLMNGEDCGPFSVHTERIDQEPEREMKAGTEMPAADHPPTLAYDRTQCAPPSLSAPPRLSIYMETAQFLLENHSLQMAQRALAQELLTSEGGLTTAYRLATAKLQMLSTDYCSAAATLQEALAHTCEKSEVWAGLGHCSYLSGDRAEARRCYERCLDYLQPPADTHPIYLRLGSVYLQDGQFQSARTTYLKVCASSPSCLTWLGLGIACYRLENLGEAEDALTEANTLNNLNPEVWGYLAMVSLKLGRRVEAEQSYKYAVKLNLQDEPVLREIKELQDQLGFGDPSF